MPGNSATRFPPGFVDAVGRVDYDEAFQLDPMEEMTMCRLFHLLLVAALLGLFFLPPAAAGEAAKKITGQRLSILHGEDDVIVKQGDQLLLRYRYRGVPKKPYVAEMTAPGGPNILLDAPPDHLHHHGLMFAWGVDGVGYWAEADDCGRQVHQAWKDLRVDSSDGPERAVLHERLLWQTPAGQTVLEEDRKLTIPAMAEGRPRLLIWQADFTSGKGATTARTIAGSNYYGLGLRPIRAMDRGGRHFNAAGGVDVAGTNGKRAAWTAYTAPLGPDRKVTVAMLSDPANPRHPCEWFTMGEQDAFAYLSGTLSVGTQPLELKPGESLSVRFAVVIFDGAVDAEPVDSLYRKLPWAPK